MTIDLEARALLPCSPARAHAEVAALDSYPAWSGIVWSATRTPAIDTDDGPAWTVEIGARIGPLRRSKRLRMVRTVDEPGIVRFDRREADGQTHSPWRLEAELAASGDGTDLVMRLEYGGTLAVPLLDRVLRAEVESAARRLGERVARVD